MGGRPAPAGEKTVEWYTPPGIFEALGLEFDLDPCQPYLPLPWIPAKKSYCSLQDGRTHPWEGRVWLNPPYGRETDGWLERFVEHGHGVALVFARTDTEWFQRNALAVDAWCLIRGRLTFVDRDREPSAFNAGAPSVLLAMGKDCVEAVLGSGLGIGVGVTERAPRPQATIWAAR
jgi:hypothetical protein